jgi:hypothetical protein
MANFAETMVYWYLRFNGFFPLTNFVLHGAPQHQRTADCDLLAVRLPHVFEKIGGQATDWDEWFPQHGFDLQRETVALIVEVKTGSRLAARAVQTSFGEKRLLQALQRTGFWPLAECRSAADALAGAPEYARAGIKAAKLLISSCPPSSANLPACHQMRLSHVNSFIKLRMQQYDFRKAPDRMFFPDDLIQYLAWESA